MSELNQKQKKLDIGEVINDAFEIYKKIALQSGLAIMCIYLVLAILFFIGVGFFFKTDELPELMKNFDPEKFSFNGKLIYLSVVIAIAALVSPYLAGILKMAQDADREEEISFATTFTYINNPKFIQIILFSATAAILGSVFNLFLKSPFNEDVGTFIGIVLSLTVNFLTYIAVPHIIFGNLNFIEAITESSKQILGNLIPALVLMIVAFILPVVGIFAFCIGIFFTLPFLYAVQYCMYKSLN
jgi:hypothetical protein